MSAISVGGIHCLLVLILVPISIFSQQTDREFAVCERRVDLAFVVDASGSINDQDPRNFDRIKDLMKALVEGLGANRVDARVAVVTFSAFGYIEFGFDSNYTNGKTKREIDRLFYWGSHTNTSGGLYLTRTRIFNEEKGDRPEVPNIAIVITDGTSTRDTHFTIPYAEEAQTEGIQVISVGIGDELNMTELNGIASPPIAQWKRVYLSKDFFTLFNLETSILQDILAVTCLTTDVYIPLPFEVCERQVDLAFIVDASGSINDQDPTGFLKIKTLLKEIVNGLEVSQVDSRIAVVTFSEIVRVEFGLDSNFSYAEAREAIDGIRFLGLHTNIALALLKMRIDVFDPAKGDRPPVPNVAILITDGNSTRDAQNTIPYADRAKEEGIQIFVVGVKDKVEDDESWKIASPPTGSVGTVFLARNFEELVDMQRDILDGVLKVTCLTSAVFAPQPIEVCRRKVDLAFVVDTSGSIKDADPGNFKKIQDLMRAIILGLQVAQVQSRIAVVTFSEKGYLVFGLNSGFTYDQTIEAINKIYFWGSHTNTSGGLYLLRTRVFRTAYGDRKKVQNFAVVITDGNSTRDMQFTIPYAKQAQAEGIQIISIGIGDKINLTELEGIASPPIGNYKRTFLTKDFNTLYDLETKIIDDILKLTCEVVTPLPVEVCHREVDLTFVVDASGSITEKDPNSFDRIKDIVRTIVGGLQIGRVQSRIAVVTFSERAVVEFGLNSNFTYEQTLQAIDQIFYMGSHTNTSGGLYLMRESVFNEKYGDRLEVPNIAILITDGNTTRDTHLTVPYAKRAKAEGIQILSVGVGEGMNVTELEQIASPPIGQTRRVFFAKDFNTLFTLQSRILDDILKVTCLTSAVYVLQPGEGCQRQADIAFVIDTSGSINDQDRRNFGRVKNIMKSIIQGLHLSDVQSQIAVVTFSEKAYVEFGFDAGLNMEQTVEAIDKIFYHGSHTNISGGLYIMRTKVFNVKYGDRDDIPNIAIVITDGNSTRDTHLTIPYAKEAQAEGIQIITVGIGSELNKTELKGIASPPLVQTQRIFFTRDFTTLSNLETRIIEDILKVTCLKDPTLVSPPMEACKKHIDLAFVVDTSGSINDDNPNNFENIRDMMKAIVGGLHIDKIDARIAVVTFSEKGYLVFGLDSNFTYEQNLKAIDNIYYWGSHTNTSGGLYIMYTTVFDRMNSGRNGDRPEVSNIAVVITDGTSTKDTKLTIPYAKEAQAGGIWMISVGIGDRLNRTELEGLASPQNDMTQRVFYTKEFDSLFNLQNKILEDILRFTCISDNRRNNG